MLNFFKKNNSLILFLIPLLSAVLLLVRPVYEPFSHSGQTFLSALLFDNILYFENIFVNQIIVFLLLNAIIFLALLVINKKNLVLGNNFLFAFIFLFLLSALSDQQEILESLFINVLLIGSLFFLSEASTDELTPYRYFNAALLISAASLLNSKLIFFSLSLPAAIIFFREGSIKEFWASLIGLALPYWLLFGLYFFATGSWSIEPCPVSFILAVEFRSSVFMTAELPALMYIAVLLVFSASFVLRKITILNTNHRLTFVLFSFGFLLLIAIAVFYTHEARTLYPVLAFLISIPISFYFNQSLKTRFNEILFGLLILLIIFVHISQHFNLFL